MIPYTAPYSTWNIITITNRVTASQWVYEWLELSVALLMLSIFSVQGNSFKSKGESDENKVKTPPSHQQVSLLPSASSKIKSFFSTLTDRLYKKHFLNDWISMRKNWPPIENHPIKKGNLPRDWTQWRELIRRTRYEVWRRRRILWAAS